MGFSNLVLEVKSKTNKGYDNLLDLSIFHLNEKWDELLLNEKTFFYFKDNNNKRIKVTIKLSDSSFVKSTGTYTWLIGLKYYPNREKIDIISSLAHEITHISQKYNGFYTFEFKKNWQKFKEIKQNNKKLTYSYYYGNVLHSENKTEHEAKLLSLFWYLKNDEFKKALNHIKKEPEYLQFDFRVFIKKMYQFGVKDTSYISKIKEHFVNFFEEKYQLVYDGYHNKKDVKCIGDFYSYILEEYRTISKLFNIDLSKYYKWIEDVLKNDLEKINRSYPGYNWDIILDNSATFNSNN